MENYHHHNQNTMDRTNLRIRQLQSFLSENRKKRELQGNRQHHGDKRQSGNSGVNNEDDDNLEMDEKWLSGIDLDDELEQISPLNMEDMDPSIRESAFDGDDDDNGQKSSVSGGKRGSRSRSGSAPSLRRHMTMPSSAGFRKSTVNTSKISSSNSSKSSSSRSLAAQRLHYENLHLQRQEQEQMMRRREEHERRKQSEDRVAKKYVYLMNTEGVEKKVETSNTAAESSVDTAANVPAPPVVRPKMLKPHQRPVFQYQVIDDSAKGTQQTGRQRRTRPISESIATKLGWDTPQAAMKYMDQHGLDTADCENQEPSGNLQNQMNDDEEESEEHVVESKGVDADNTNDTEMSDGIAPEEIEAVEREVEALGVTYSPTEEYEQSQLVYQDFMDECDNVQTAFDKGQSELAQQAMDRFPRRTSFSLPSSPRRRYTREYDMGSKRLHHQMDKHFEGHEEQKNQQQHYQEQHDGVSESEIEGKYAEEFKDLESQIAKGKIILQDLQALAQHVDPHVDPIKEKRSTMDRTVCFHESGMRVITYLRTGMRRHIFPDAEGTDIVVQRNGDIRLNTPTVKTVQWSAARKLLQTTFPDGTRLRHFIGMGRCERTLPDETSLKLQVTGRGLYKILVYPTNDASGRVRERILPNGMRQTEFAGGLVETVYPDGKVKFRFQEVQSDGNDGDDDNDSSDDSSDDDGGAISPRFIC